MNPTRFYKTTILLLILINISTLFFLWWSRPEFPPPPPPPWMERSLGRELGLSGETLKKVEDLEKDHHAEKQMLLEKDIDLHEAYFALVGTGTSPDSLLNEIQANKRRIEEITFVFFDRVSGYCTDEQKEKLIESINMRLVRLGPPPPPPHFHP